MSGQTRCRYTLAICLVATMIVPLLAGCRAEEQNRILMYKPGEYMGEKQTGLSADQVRALQYRAREQSSSVTPLSGG